jgi:thiamine kinase-like enzyme
LTRKNQDGYAPDVGRGLESPPLDPALRSVVQAMPGWSEAARLVVVPIPGGITNQNFRVDVDGDSFVVRLAGKDTELLGIDREAERRAAEAAATVGVGPEVIGYLPQHSALVTRFIEGEAILPEAMREPDTLARVVRAFRTFHGGPEIPATFSSFRVVERYRETAERHGVQVPPVFDELLRLSREIERALEPFAPRPCHNDLLNANFIRRGERVFIVDWEYAGMGNVFFDLANFSVNHAFDDAADEALLEQYFGEVTDSRRAGLKIMRIMSDFREAMWGVVQQGISTLDFDYGDYAERHFARCLQNAHDSRYTEWLRAAGKGSS